MQEQRVGAERSGSVYRGRCFKLVKPTLSVEFQEGRQTPVTLPPGSVIEVTCGPMADGLVDFRWEGRTLRMFAMDLW